MGTERKMVDSGVEWVGDIPATWESARVKDVSTCLDSRRIPLNSEEREPMAGNIPYWGAGGVVDRINTFIFNETLVLLGEDGAPFDDKSRDVSFLVTGKTWINNHIHALRAKTVNPSYLRHALNAVDYMPHVGGATRMKLTQGAMNSIRIPLPPLPEQQAIATFLDHHVGLIDRERELIDQKIGLLKDKRNALIFECVTGKRTIVEAQHLAGVDDWSDIVGSGPLVAVPTPGKDDPFVKGGRLVDSGVDWIGEVPEGWEVSSLKNTVSISRARTTGNDFYVGMENISSGTGRLIPGDDARTVENGIDSTFREGDILFGKLRPYLRKVWVADRNGSCSTEFLVMDAGTLEINRFLFYTLLTDEFCSLVNNNCKGVKMPRADWENIGSTPVVLPSPQEQKTIVTFLDHQVGLIDSEIELLETKSSLLADKRKALIFEAVTGKIDCTQP